MILRLLALPLLMAATVSAQPAPSPAAQLLSQLQQVGLDPPACFKVSDIYLRRDAIRLHLQHGTIVFMKPVAGRITGAVFEGAGEALVMPTSRAERQQMVKFTGSAILAESFSSAYFRFTDHTAADLLTQIHRGGGRPLHDPGFVARWGQLLLPTNRYHSLRILMDFLDPRAGTYFHAGINGDQLGAFHILMDDRRDEPVLVGQLRYRDERPFYDVWASFAPREPSAPAASPRTGSYRIQATITPQGDLEALCEVDLEIPPPAPPFLLFSLSRLLQVEEVSELPALQTAGGAQPLEFLREISLAAEEARYRGSDAVLVVLPPSATNERRTLRFRYRGNIISTEAPGKFKVEERDTWYPTLDPLTPAHYSLRFRFPRSLQVVATGSLREEKDAGEWKESLWITTVPVPVAGFNVGTYQRTTVEVAGERVVVYAVPGLEPDAAESSSSAPRGQHAFGTIPERVGTAVASALAFLKQLYGPVPYPELKVSPMPGQVAQGYPGLLYLSTFCFLPEQQQIRQGLDPRSREHFAQIVPAHEAAHQWWGNWVRMPHSRNQWLAEGLSTYSALLYLEDQPGGLKLARGWLERFRDDLLELDDQDEPVEATGALTLGTRLISSRSPSGYASLIYSKGPWVVHMLRHLLRDPETGSDQLFLTALHELAGRSQELTTEEFQQHLEARLPAYADLEGNGRLDWFFNQWVRDIGLPHYRLTWQARKRADEGWQVEGAIEQSKVPYDFTMAVPLYARFGSELRRLGKVIVSGEEVPFHFALAEQPDDLVLDPHLTTLFAPE